MSLNAIRTVTRSRLVPVAFPELARTIAVRLPGGVNYAAGTVLGQRTAITAANEVQTATVSGTPTGGTFKLGVQLQFGSVTPTVSIAHNATAATVQAALETILGVGNVTVTGSAGGPWAITFTGDFAASQIPLLTLATNALTGGSSPSVGIAETTAGSDVGGLFAAYDDALSDGTQVARALLEHNVITDMSGRVMNEFGVASALTVPAFVPSGGAHFLCSDLVGLDANAVADLGKLVQGAAFNSAGAILML